MSDCILFVNSSLFAAHLLGVFVPLGSDQVKPNALIVPVHVVLLVHLGMLPGHGFSGQVILADFLPVQKCCGLRIMLVLVVGSLRSRSPHAHLGNLCHAHSVANPVHAALPEVHYVAGESARLIAKDVANLSQLLVQSHRPNFRGCVRLLESRLLV